MSLIIPFNKKIRNGFIGRLRTRKKLVDFKNNTFFSKVYWFHVSSHGEFQQIQSIIEEIKRDKNKGIIVSFFSPSGFNNVHNENIDCKINPEWIKNNANKLPIQGGLDPKILLTSKENIKKNVDYYLNVFSGYPYIFNLGHGVLPETDPSMIKFIIQIVRDKNNQ